MNFTMMHGSTNIKDRECVHSDMLIASCSLTQMNKNLEFSQINPAIIHLVTFKLHIIKHTKFVPVHALKAYRWSRSTAPLMLNLLAPEFYI